MARTSNNKTSVLYAIVSHTIVLILIGLFLMLFFHSNAISSIVKERINIIVELEDGLSSDRIKEIGRYIADLPEVKDASVDFVSSKEAIKIMGGSLEIQIDEEESPFMDVIVFNVLPDYYVESELVRLKGVIKDQNGVGDVVYENVIIDNIKSNLNKISLVLLVLNVFFLILVIVIIYNTINLSLYADRWEIKTMEIIGARDRFIRQPYLKIAGRISLTSFSLATVFILLIIGALYLNSDFIASAFRWYFLVLSLGIIFIISFIITIVATIRIVNKYLYTEEGALYE